jgi:hypothetical protein
VKKINKSSIVQTKMWAKQRCRGCRKSCIGRADLTCLDCEAVLDTLRDQGFRHGLVAGLEAGVRDPHPVYPALDPKTIPRLTLRPVVEDAAVYSQAYAHGVAGGLRQAAARRRVYAKILRQVVVEAGRRAATGVVAVWVARRPRVAHAFEPAVLGWIRAMVRGP